MEFLRWLIGKDKNSEKIKRAKKDDDFNQHQVRQLSQLLANNPPQKVIRNYYELAELYGEGTTPADKVIDDLFEPVDSEMILTPEVEDVLRSYMYDLTRESDYLHKACMKKLHAWHPHGDLITDLARELLEKRFQRFPINNQIEKEAEKHK